MKVLFTTPILEYPAAGGPSLRVENSIKALSKVCELEVVYRCRGIAPPNFEVHYYRTICDQFTLHPSPFSNRYARYLNRLLMLNICQEARHIVRRVDQSGAQIIWFGYGNISFQLIKRIKHLRPRLKLVCDTDSVWSRFVLRGLPYSRGIRRMLVLLSGKFKEREERLFTNICDITTAVSDVDSEYYRSIAQDPCRVRLFQNVIDPESYREVPCPPKTFYRPAIYLAGTFGFGSPMENAARWVIHEILPIIRVQYPEVQFYIVGKGSDYVLSDISDPKITITGKVLSVLPYLCHMDIALVPLKFESGTRFKILEAGACGIPIVSTTLGAEGIPLTNGKNILIADNSKSFARAVIRLLSDRDFAKQIAHNCRNFILKNYTIDVLSAEAESILMSLRTRLQ